MSSLSNIFHPLLMNVQVAIQACFIAVALSILSVRLFPPLANRFLAYGSRTSSNQPSESSGSMESSPKTSGKGADIIKSQSAGLLDSFAELKVPHSWFASFYVLSVLTSLFWAPQILLKIGLVPYITASSLQKAPTMTLQQVLVTWALMLVQGARRLYESLAFAKPSSSQMWIGHWAVGVWFYAMMSVAIWIEGSPALEHSSFTPKHFLFTGPSFQTFVGTLLFMLASGLQHDCHAYLASLKKYTLPEHPAFSLALCPHYFAECLIYVALSIIAAPSGHFINRTIFCALIFVTINLGVTADGTKTWYEQKFGKDTVGSRARMVPLLY